MSLPTPAEINDALVKLQSEQGKDFVNKYLASAAVSIVKLTLDDDEKDFVVAEGASLTNFVKKFTDRFDQSKDSKDNASFFGEMSEELTRIAEKEAKQSVTAFLTDYNMDKEMDVLMSPSWYTNMKDRYFKPIELSRESADYKNLDSFVTHIASFESDEVVQQVKDQISDDIQNAQAKKQIVASAVDSVNDVKKDTNAEFDQMRTAINPAAAAPDPNAPPADGATPGAPADPNAPPPADGTAPAAPAADGSVPPPADPAVAPPADGAAPAAPPADGAAPAGVDPSLIPASGPAPAAPADGAAPPPADPNAPPPAPAAAAATEDKPAPAAAPAAAPAEGKDGKQIHIHVGSESINIKLTPEEAAKMAIPVSPTALKMMKIDVPSLESLLIRSGGVHFTTPFTERMGYLKELVAKENDPEATKKLESFESIFNQVQKKLLFTISNLGQAGLSLRGPLNAANALHIQVAKSYAKRRTGITEATMTPRPINSFESAVEAALDLVELNQNGEAAKDPTSYGQREEAFYTDLKNSKLEGEQRSLTLNLVQTKTIPMTAVVDIGFVDSMKDLLINTKSENEILMDAYGRAEANLKVSFGRDLQASERVLLNKAISGESIMVNPNLYERFLMSIGSKQQAVGTLNKTFVAKKAKVMTSMVYTMECLGLVDRKDKEDLILNTLNW